MLGGKRREQQLTAEAEAQARAAEQATETDDSSVDPDWALENDQEPPLV